MDLITWVLLIVGLFVAGVVFDELYRAVILKVDEKIVADFNAAKADIASLANRVRSIEQGIVAKVEAAKKAL